ncbi:PDR/VanB family oxidoreductase [Cryptosporangium sp. NPDC051539]|uniref:PDR/VanB family oxidoreductase n=1 Tax=Cryptosporangium sp. NPDC051539 TaxID=3363962 RepID=UPI0037A8DE3E
MPDEIDLRLRIGRREAAADGVVLLDLHDPDGARLPDWAPGAHVDLVLGEYTRQYSLCGDPADRSRWRIAILRDAAGRGGSVFAHDRLATGDVVGVRGPRNHFPLDRSPRYLFVAGGIGITPIVPMVAAAAAANADWELHYGGRSRASMAFQSRLTEEYGPRVRVRAEDETGPLDLDSILSEPRSDTLIYCCGPESLLRAVEERCTSGVLRVERFSPRARPETLGDGSFEVVLRRSGLTLTVAPGRSILDVVEAAGLPVLSSCREGTCGTCETTVLAGRVDHRDSLLTPEEQAADDTMFICVSRAASSPLILDL